MSAPLLQKASTNCTGLEKQKSTFDNIQALNEIIDEQSRRNNT